MNHDKKEIEFIFQNFVVNFQEKTIDYNSQDVFWHILLWTGGQKRLTENICQYIIKNINNAHSKNYYLDEGSLVEKLITNYLEYQVDFELVNSQLSERIYRKKFTNIIRRNQGQVSQKERLELVNIRQKLGLSFQQVEEIEKNALQSFKNKQKKINLQLPISSDRFNSTSSDFNAQSIITPSPSLANQIITQENLKQKLNKIKKKYRDQKLWRYANYSGLVFLALLLVWLVFGVNNWQVSNIKKINRSEQDYTLCGDINKFKSNLRMSVGDKILTAKSLTNLNQAVDAMTNCNWDLAIANFQRILNQTKNNPEARIYLNNAQAAVYPSLKIAVSVPIGTKLAVAEEILRGVAQAQTEINQEGGIEGKPLQVQIANDDNKPEIAQEIASQLAKDNKILAVVGHNSTNTSLAASFVYQKDNLVMISPTSTALNPTEIGNYIFRVPPSIKALSSALGEYTIKNLKKTKIAVCSNSQSVASQSFVNDFTVAVYRNQGQIIPINCDFSAENFTPNQINFQQLTQQADALLLAPSVEYIDKAIALAQVNHNQIPLLGDHSMYIFETIQQGQANTNNMVLPVPWQPASTADTFFNQNAVKMWGGEVNWRSAMAYDATITLIQGLKQSDTRVGLQTALSDRRFSVSGATGQFKFDRGGRVGEVSLVKIEPGKSNNGEKYQFVPIKP